MQMSAEDRWLHGCGESEPQKVCHIGSQFARCSRSSGSCSSQLQNFPIVAFIYSTNNRIFGLLSQLGDVVDIHSLNCHHRDVAREDLFFSLLRYALCDADGTTGDRQLQELQRVRRDPSRGVGADSCSGRDDDDSSHDSDGSRSFNSQGVGSHRRRDAPEGADGPVGRKIIRGVPHDTRV